MGGYGSTRWNGCATRATTQSTLALSVEAFRDALKPETDAVEGSARWMFDGRKQEMGLTLWPAEEHPETGRIVRTCTLAFAASTDDEKAAGTSGKAVRLNVPMESVPAPLGGRRWWFLCPTCDHRRAELYLVQRWGAWRFECRRCARLAYPSQHENPEHRAYRRAKKLSERLRVKVATPAELEDCIGWTPPRPKGMRRATYDALLPRWGEAVRVHNEIAEDAFDRRLGGWNKRFGKNLRRRGRR